MTDPIKQKVTYEDYTTYSGESNLTLKETITLFESMNWGDGSYLCFNLNIKNTFQIMWFDNTKFIIEITNDTEGMIFKQRYATNKECKEIIPYFFQGSHQEIMKDFYNVPIINKTLEEVIREKNEI